MLEAKGIECYPVRLICHALEIAPSTYYARKKQPLTERETTYEGLKIKARELFEKNHCEYGRIRLHKALNEAGETVSLGKTAQLMQDALLIPKSTRKYKATTNSKHAYPVAENLLNQDFSTEKPNEKWCGDSTYIRTNEGWLYVAGIIDLCDRTCVGLSFGIYHTKELMIESLKNAWRKYRPKPGLIFHSDRGVQYASNAYKEQLNDYKMIQSMSRKGNPYDNAAMESFWATLKKSCVFETCFKTRKAAKQAIFNYVFGFYNTLRYHTAIGLETPLNYRNRLLAEAA